MHRAYDCDEPENSDDDESDWGEDCDNLDEILDPTLDDDWDAEALESERDFYDELRDRYDDEFDPI